MGRFVASLLVVLLAVLSCFAAGTDPPMDGGKFEFKSYKEVLALFRKLGYTPEAWQSGIREVPRVFLTEIPERWRDTTSKEVTVLNKKRIFFRALAPLVLRANELILADRKRLDALKASEASLSREDAAWVGKLAERYGVQATAGEPVSSAVIEALWKRVDIIPVSLALSQAADESGWGTSRFAAEGNALFGQWSWGKDKITPGKQRTALGDYGIQAFESPLKSVMAYMLNINSHRAYTKLREIRAEARSRGEKPSGRELATGLDKYSERGEAYVDSLHSIMRVNKLGPTDDAHLTDGPTTFLVPVGEGA